jgi:tetratricopeptide (TPR) repeat protein
VTSLEINPKQMDVRYNLGTLYAEQNRLQEALAELKEAARLDPDYAPAWSNLALVAEKLELDSEAIEAHEKLIALGKGQAVNYFHIGVLYAKGNQPDPAIAALTKAVELEPQKYRALLNEELKKVHSVLDSIRYKPDFTKLLKTD